MPRNGIIQENKPDDGITLSIVELSIGLLMEIGIGFSKKNEVEFFMFMCLRGIRNKR